MLKFKSKAFAGLMVALVLSIGAISIAQADTINLPSTGVKKTSTSTNIKSLQAFLNWSLGSTITPLVVDGKWGAKTTAAIKAYQKANGLVADGSFGKLSAAKAMALQASGTTTTVSTPGCGAGALYSSITGAPCSATTTTTQQIGTVTAALASDTPASGYIINGQATADLAHFAFTGTGMINSVTLHRSGVSSQNTLSNVYLFNGSTRITDGFSFNTSGDIVINNLGITVNGTVILAVKADVASDTASSLAVSLTSFTNGTTVNAVNIMGNTMTYGTGSLATASLNAQTVNSPSVNAGTSAFTLWSSSVQINTRTEWLKGINFRVTGSAPSDAIQNAHLFIDGVDTGKVASIGSITGSTYVMFDFSAMPVSLTTGSHTIDLRADVVKGASYNLVVSLQQASDIVLYDPQVGANIAVTGTVPNSTGTIVISTGSASTTVDPTFQALSNITGGTTNAVIGKFKVHGYAEDVKVTTLSVTPVLSGMKVGSAVSVSGNTAGLNNVTLYFNGSQVCSATGASSWLASALSFNCGSQMILPAGTDSYIEVHADLQNAATGTGSNTTAPNQNYTGGVVSVTLNTGTTSSASGQSSKAGIAFPSTSVSTPGLTVSTGVLSLSKNTGYSNQTIGPNAVSAKIGSFTLQNQSTTESVRVTNLLVNLAFTGVGSTNYSNLTTSDSTTPINPATAAAGGNADNNFSANFTIAPNSTHTVDVFADTGSYTSAATVIVSLKPTTFGVSSNVNLTPASAQAGQTITIGTSTITAASASSVSLLTASSTSAQYVPTANGGATDSSKATFKILATGGAATISEMKFSVNSQLEGGAGAGTTASAGALTAGSQAITIVADPRFAVGDFVKITGTTPAYGYVTANSSTTLTVNVTTAGTGTASRVDIIPGTVTAIRIGSITTPVVNGLAYIQGLSLSVPNGGAGLSQDVYVSYGEVGTTGLPSGSTARIGLEYIKYSSGGSTPTTICTTAIQTCTGILGLTGTGTAVSSPTMILVGSNPTVSISTPSGAILQAGANVEAIDVTVTAGAKGPITINSFPINTVQSIGTGATFTLKTGTGNPITVKDANGTPITVDTSSNFSAATGGAATVTITGGYPLNAGQSVTFKVFIPVNALSAGTNTNNIYATANTNLATGTGFTWTDTAGGATAANALDVTATTTTGTVISGMYNYPSTTVSSIHN